MTEQTGGSSVEMPRNGEINKTFGVYRSRCCSREIVIREGATFPDCPNHPKLSTAWIAIEFEVAEVVVIKKKSKSDPAA